MFVPNGVSGNITANGTSQSVDISSADPETGAIRFNSGGAPVRVRFGDNTVIAVAPDDMQLAPNIGEIFKIPVDATHFAAITYGGGSVSVGYTIGQNI